MKALLKLSFLLLGLSTLISETLMAQSDNLVIRNYSIKDGLPSGNVLSIFQDSQGFIWAGLHTGLTKFDGYTFTNYKINPLDTNSLTNHNIASLWEDNQQRLWIATFRGLEILDLKKEKFKRIPLDPLNPSREINVRQILGKKNGMVWLATFEGIYQASPETMFIKKIYDYPEDSVGNRINRITQSADGSIWATSGQVGLSGHGLINISNSGVITHYRHDPEDPKSIASNEIIALYTDSSNRLWIGTSYGLDLFNPQNQSFIHYLPDDLKFIHNNPAQHELFFDILEMQNGRLALASTFGLYDFDPITGKFDLIVEKYNMRLYRDRQDILWWSSIGLSQISPLPKKFSIYHQFGDSDVSNLNVSIVMEDKNDGIWVRTWNPTTQIFRFNKKRKTFQKLNQKNQDFWLDFGPLASKIDMWERSWFRENEIYRYDIHKQKSEVIKVPNRIVSIYEDSLGYIWIGGWNGFGRYDISKGKYEEITARFYRPQKILEDSFGKIWIAGYGLFRYDRQTKKLDSIWHIPGDSEGIPDNRIGDFIISQKGEIWISTQFGFSKMITGTSNTTPRFTHWNTYNSELPDDHVHQIVEDDDGSLWIINGNMLSHFSPQTAKFRNYGPEDGLPDEGLTDGMISEDGNIYFGSAGGMVVLDPKQLRDNPYIPPVVITKMYIHDQLLPIKESYSDTLSLETPLAASITYTDKLELPYHQNDFALEFAALNYLNPENNQYKFKLEPYETEWIETTAENRIARYTNISPGEYTFRVIGSNNDGLWNEEGTSLHIIIHPPWWMTWWAYVLYGMLAVGVLLTIRYYEMKRMKIRDRAKYLSELDQLKTRFFTNISHEFRTPLTLILGPLKSMYEGTFTGDRKSALAVMIRNGQRLLTLINQLLDISKLEAGKMKMQVINTDLVQLLQSITASYESLAKEKQIRYFFYPDRQELKIDLDQDKTEKIVHNLLSNAFKFTPEGGGEVILHLKVEAKWAVIQVKDSGQGIPSADLDKVFDRFYQVDSSQTRTHEGSGLGMALAKELVELHGGTITLESKEGQGTTFTVRLPIEQKHITRGEADNDDVDAREIEAVVSTREFSDLEIEEEIVEEKNSLPVLLIVEDNPDMRKYIKNTLQEQFQIREAENGKEGLTIAKEIMPDLIISDVMMPEMDGFQLCKKIKTEELTSHIPVILLTAKADRSSKLSGLGIGADDYLSKPFDAEELKLIVKNRIAERQKMRERFSKDITLEPGHIAITSMNVQFLDKVMEIIEDKMSDDQLNVEALSQEAGYSQVQFYRKLKALTNQTPSQFLRTIRLKRAAELIRQKSDSISRIAYRVGFSSIPYFTKCFREQFGVPPGQYAEYKQEVK